jgi:hypothetical protein
VDAFFVSFHSLPFGQLAIHYCKPWIFFSIFRTSVSVAQWVLLFPWGFWPNVVSAFEGQCILVFNVTLLIVVDNPKLICWMLNTTGQLPMLAQSRHRHLSEKFISLRPGDSLRLRMHSTGPHIGRGLYTACSGYSNPTPSSQSLAVSGAVKHHAKKAETRRLCLQTTLDQLASHYTRGTDFKAWTHFIRSRTRSNMPKMKQTLMIRNFSLLTIEQIEIS